MEGKNFMGKQLQKWAGIFVFAVLMTVFCINFYSSNIRSFPSSIHAWAQGDRYALALNFQKNGFDLFHPQTYNLRPQFPAKIPVTKETGITQVDCPIHEYIIALIMKVVGNNSPFVFRLYNLLYGLLGFLCLFLLVRNNTKSQLKALAVVVFAFLSPVLVYYFDGMLPSTSSIASTLIGYYFFFEYRRNKEFHKLVLAVLFAFIAALSRTPFALILGTMLCQVLYEMIKQKKLKLKELIPFAVAFTILLGFFIHNLGLAKIYGSVFLMNIRPVYDRSEFIYVYNHIIEAWIESYFTKFHYWIIAITVLIFLIRLKRRPEADSLENLNKSFLLFNISIKMQWKRSNKWRVFQGIKLSKFQKDTGFQFLIVLTGALIYFWLMLAQYHDHDYYFLDSFYIPFVLLFVFLIDSIDLNKLIAKIIFVVVLFMFGYMAFKKCNNEIKWRYNSDINNFALAEANNYKGSSQYLDSLGISRDSKILVMKSYSANIPLLLMNRTGYALLYNHRHEIIESLNWDFDYVTMQNDYIFSDIINNYPEIINELQPIGTNGKITVFKKQYGEKSIKEFLQLKDDIVYCASSCEEIKDSCLFYLSQDLPCDSVCLINCDSEFVDLFDYRLDQAITDNRKLIFKADCRLKTFNNRNSTLMLSINNNDELVYQRSFDLNYYLGDEVKEEFNTLYFTFPLRYKQGTNTSMKLYVWNNGKNEVELKNILVIIL